MLVRGQWGPHGVYLELRERRRTLSYGQMSNACWKRRLRLP
jgi:hypothetical protein